MTEGTWTERACPEITTTYDGDAWSYAWLDLGGERRSGRGYPSEEIALEAGLIDVLDYEATLRRPKDDELRTTNPSRA